MNESTRFAGKKFSLCSRHSLLFSKKINSLLLSVVKNAENCPKDRPLEKTGYENTLQLPQALAKFAA
jgi:hypothetical protein